MSDTASDCGQAAGSDGSGSPDGGGLLSRNVTWDVLSQKINDLVVVADSSGTIFYVSPACRTLGYTQDQLVGHSPAEFVHPEDLPHFQGNMAVLFDGAAAEDPADREHRFRRSDGAWVWLEGNPSLIHGPDGQPIGLINVFRDVTEKRAIREALRERERRYRLLAENTTDMISCTASDGRHIYLSPSVARMTGYSIAELMPKQMRDFVHPDDLKRFLRFYGELVSGRSEGGRSIRYRVLHRNGEWMWVESNPRLVKSTVAGELDDIIDVTRDVTDQEALRDQLREALVQAEQAAVVKGEFLANMSHEIRTPLTAVLGYASLLGERGDLDDVARGHVARIEAAGRGLLAIVNDVLDFSKLEAGLTTITPRPTDVTGLAREVLEMFVFQARAKSLEFRFEAADGIPETVSIDGNRLRQVLINLIGNAVKFTDRGSVAVRASYDAAAERLAVEITDTGPGIPAKARERLFQRFSQVDGSSTRVKGGSGLGLAICQGLAEAMGGAVSLRSRVGRGSTFRLELPAPSAAAMACEDGGPEASEALEGLRVLVADDSPVNRELVRAMLEPYGVEVSEACDGAHAVEVTAGLPIDVILMDVRMPRLDGRAAALAIRDGKGPNRDIPILSFSADTVTSPGRPELGAPFSGAVHKPLQPRDLLDALHRAVEFTPAKEDLSDVG